MPIHHLDYCEFYITHVCNLNCPGCNRCNNFNFTGHSRWNDHQQELTEWAKKISIDHIGILGGEPTLNPDFLYWVQGVAALWNQSRIRIITNGTQLSRWPELYELVSNIGSRISIEVNCHNLETKQQLIDQIMGFLKMPVTTNTVKVDRDDSLWKNCYANVKDSTWPACDTPEDFKNLPQYIQDECRNVHHISPEIWCEEVYGTEFIDVNGIRVALCMSDSFNNSTVKYDPTRHSLSLHDSDPKKAMDICYFKACHHFYNGKLFKCGPMAVLPDFIEQFDLDMTPHQKTLIESYQPALSSWDDTHLDQFIQGLKDAVPIPQCSLCPESIQPNKFKATTKKIKFQKRIVASI